MARHKTVYDVLTDAINHFVNNLTIPDDLRQKPMRHDVLSRNLSAAVTNSCGASEVNV